MTATVYATNHPAASHNFVNVDEITADKWTVIATRTGIYWTWRDDYHSVHAHQALRAASDANEIIIMHRRVGRGWELFSKQ